MRRDEVAPDNRGLVVSKVAHEVGVLSFHPFNFTGYIVKNFTSPLPDPWTPDWIRGLRKAMSLTQSAFGQTLGVGLSQVQKLEGGKTSPSERVVAILNQLFGEFEVVPIEAPGRAGPPEKSEAQANPFDAELFFAIQGLKTLATLLQRRAELDPDSTRETRDFLVRHLGETAEALKELDL